jgi:hypothetical protein
MLRANREPEWESQSDEETTRMTTRTFSCTAMAVLLLGAAFGTMASAEKERKTATAGIKGGKGQNAGQAKLGGGARRRPMFEQMKRDAARISST